MAHLRFNPYRTYFIPPNMATTEWVDAPIPYTTDRNNKSPGDTVIYPATTGGGSGTYDMKYTDNTVSDELVYWTYPGTPPRVSKDAIEEDMEVLDIDDAIMEGKLDKLIESIPEKGWFTRVSSEGIEHVTLLSGTFKMKDVDILREISDRISRKESIKILLNHDSKNPVDKDAIRVYYAPQDMEEVVVPSSRVMELIDGKEIVFLGYIPGERGEYLNRNIVDFWESNNYSNTKVGAIAFFNNIKAPGIEARFWNILIVVTLSVPYRNGKILRLEL